MPILLGHAIAHELGHLLLPPGHSGLGIMQLHLDPHTALIETFTGLQTAIMQRRLRAGAQDNPAQLSELRLID